MSLMDFLPLDDRELVDELRKMMNEIRENAYAGTSYEEAFKAHVLLETLDRLRELERIRFFMSVRIDEWSEGTVLDYYEGLDKDTLDRMRKEWNG